MKKLLIVSLILILIHFAKIVLLLALQFLAEGFEWVLFIHALTFVFWMFLVAVYLEWIFQRVRIILYLADRSVSRGRLKK